MTFPRFALHNFGERIVGGRRRWSARLWSAAAAAIVVVSVHCHPAAASTPEVDASAEQPVESGSDLEFKGFPLAGYTPETSLTFGGVGLVLAPPASLEPEGRTSTVLAAGLYSLNGQWVLNVAPNFWLDAGAWNVKSRLSLLNWPTSFFGVGSHTDKSDEQRYDATALEVDTTVRRRVFWPNLYVGAEYFFSTRDIEPHGTGALQDPDVVGTNGGYLSAVGVNLGWDTRDNSFAATEGTFIEASAMAYTPLLGSDYRYMRFKLEGRHYFDLSHQQVVAVQGLWESHVGDVPFYKLAKLGGQKRLRGIYKGRYRDKNLLLAQVEYRSPPLWRLRLAGFGGIGEVYGDQNALSLDALKWSAGVGLRMAIDEDEGINLRADFGLSPEGTGFYLSIGEAF